jgi:hypothetical protein
LKKLPGLTAFCSYRALKSCKSAKRTRCNFADARAWGLMRILKGSPSSRVLVFSFSLARQQPARKFLFTLPPPFSPVCLVSAVLKSRSSQQPRPPNALKSLGTRPSSIDSDSVRTNIDGSIGISASRHLGTSPEQAEMRR